MSKKKRKQTKRYESTKTIFVIPQLVKIEGLREKQAFKSSDPISPIFGRKVKNVEVPENKVVDTGDIDTRYDSFRDENRRRISAEERAQYREFTNIHTDKSREEFLGSPVYHPTSAEVAASKAKPEKLRPIGINNHNEVIETNFTKDFKDETKQKPLPNYSNLKSEFGKTEQKPMEEPEVFAKPWVHPVDEIKDEPTKVSVFEKEPVSRPIETKLEPKRQDKTTSSYKLPSVKLFKTNDLTLDDKPEWLLEQVETINRTLAEFNIEGHVVGTKKGPTVTRYEIDLEGGIKVKRVESIGPNLMMNLASSSIRIEAPIPGKPYVGIEVPNKVAEIVNFGNVVSSKEFTESFDKPLKVALGVDIDGNNIYTDISGMPHGLIAGATNSGKSVCVNTILVSLLLKNRPEDLRLILIDPKIVELQPYQDLPHLITPVITDAKIAATALKWVVDEMENRYEMFANNRSRDITSYNKNVLSGVIKEDKMPYIVIVIDELADLIQVASQDVEDSIQRITQKARAAGIHLLVATQRPSTDVVKGTIKSNIPTRIAFKVASFVDSTTILDGQGAETLLGRGDMLFKEKDKTIRLQGAFIPDHEIYMVTDFIRNNSTTNYIFEHEELQFRVKMKEDVSDELFEPVAYFVVKEQKCSINGITQEFNIGFNRASTIVNGLESYGIVSEGGGTKAREVLVDMVQLEALLKND